MGRPKQQALRELVIQHYQNNKSITNGETEADYEFLFIYIKKKSCVGSM